MKAMVMAAGAGTRLHPLTTLIPKPMVPILNRPVLEYTVLNLAKNNVRDIAFNLHSFPEQIRSYFGNGRTFGVEITYSHEPRLLGTAGGVKKLESFFGRDSFVVLSGDGLTTINLSDLFEFHRTTGAIATLALTNQDTQLAYGVTVLKKNKVDRFIEKPFWRDYVPGWVNTGIYVLEPDVLKRIPKKSAYDFGSQLWPDFLKRRKRLAGYRWDGFWCDIGNPLEYRRAQAYALDHVREFRSDLAEQRPGIWLEQGASIHPNARLTGPCLIGSGAQIGPDCSVGPYVVLGKNVRLEKKVHIQRSSVWAGAVIGAGSHLDDVIVMHGSNVPKSTAAVGGVLLKK